MLPGGGGPTADAGRTASSRPRTWAGPPERGPAPADGRFRGRGADGPAAWGGRPRGRDAIGPAAGAYGSRRAGREPYRGQTWMRRSTALTISSIAWSIGTPFFCSPLR